jgi:hypothetical protein
VCGFELKQKSRSSADPFGMIIQAIVIVRSKDNHILVNTELLTCFFFERTTDRFCFDTIIHFFFMSMYISIFEFLRGLKND